MKGERKGEGRGLERRGCYFRSVGNNLCTWQAVGMIDVHVHMRYAINVQKCKDYIFQL